MLNHPQRLPFYFLLFTKAGLVYSFSRPCLSPDVSSGKVWYSESFFSCHTSCHLTDNHIFSPIITLLISITLESSHLSLSRYVHCTILTSTGNFNYCLATHGDNELEALQPLSIKTHVWKEHSMRGKDADETVNVKILKKREENKKVRVKKKRNKALGATSLWLLPKVGHTTTQGW